MPPRSESVLIKYAYPVGGAILGYLSVGVGNITARRPFMSGVPRHVTFAVLGGAIGYFVDQRMSKYYAERDAMIRHYMELHPEDFVEEKRKYRDIFEKWYPQR